MATSPQRVIAAITELDPDAQRQYIDARSTFLAHEQLTKLAASVRGGMVWKTVKGTDYLIRTSPQGDQKSLGPRTPQLEQVHADFVSRKASIEERLRAAREQLDRHKRLNKALRVGRTPSLVVRLLQSIANTGLNEHFRVVGTHALYAYETAAGVRFPGAIATTMDVDLLWDTRKRITFSQKLARADGSMMALLRKLDPSFRLDEIDKYRAINSAGFYVDILRRPAAEDDPHPVRLSDDEEDFWVVQAERADELVNAPGFSEVIVGLDGSMARMNTIDPREFVRFKLWMSTLKTREAVKRQRDGLQAQAVNYCVQEYMPQLDRASPDEEGNQAAQEPQATQMTTRAQRPRG